MKDLASFYLKFRGPEPIGSGCEYRLQVAEDFGDATQQDAGYAGGRL